MIRLLSRKAGPEIVELDETYVQFYHFINEELRSRE